MQSLQAARETGVDKRQSSAPFQGSVQIKFWSQSWEPQKALDPISNFGGKYGPTDNKFEVKPGGDDWRRAKVGSTLVTIWEWAQDNGLTVVNTELVAQRHKRSRWEGLYILTIAPRSTTH